MFLCASRLLRLAPFASHRFAFLLAHS